MDNRVCVWKLRDKRVDMGEILAKSTTVIDSIVAICPIFYKWDWIILCPKQFTFVGGKKNL